MSVPCAIAQLGRPCPCGSTQLYAACCEPLHLGVRQAETPESLMRSRYVAYVLGLGDYVLRTWHPRTRPAQLTLSPDDGWLGLRIVRCAAQSVEFVAAHRDGALHEVSRFEQRAGRWFYLDGDVTAGR